jgi:hypothetical protein
MATSAYSYKEEIICEIEGMPDDQLKQIMDFVYFIKAKEVIDPSQSYFWTKKWQKMEKSADRDKYLGNIIGDGTIDGLMDELNT